MMLLKSLTAFLFALVHLACSLNTEISRLASGNDPDSGPAVPAPPLPKISYPTSEVTYYLGDSVNLTPSEAVGVSFSITPALPAGMSFDASTGEIGGVPSGPMTNTQFEITATNGVDSVSTTIDLAIGKAISVNSGPDLSDTNPGDGSCVTATPDHCPLRAALEEASASLYPSKVILPSGFVLTDSPLSFTGTSPLEIEGQGSGSTSIRPSAGAFRVLELISAAKISLSHLTISNGTALGTVGPGGGIYASSPNLDLTLDNVVIVNSQREVMSGSPVDGGAGLYFNGRDLTVTSSNFTSNTTTAGGGSSIQGGAIHVKSGRNVQIQGSVFTANTSLDGGAVAIEWTSGAVSVADSSFENNTATSGRGGAIRSGRDLTISRSFFGSNNSMYDGGALFLQSAQTTITDSTFAANSISMSFSNGAAIYHSSGFDQLTIRNSTFHGNTGGGAGKAIFVFGASDVIFSNNIITAHGGMACESLSGSLISEGGNIEQGDTCGFTDISDLTNTDPLIDVAGLGLNGGPTKNYPLQSGSPAIDSGVESKCTATDQRGVARVSAQCDRGAHEYQAPP